MSQPMPATGWPCTGNCGRQSQLTPEGSAYRCWNCRLLDERKQKGEVQA